MKKQHETQNNAINYFISPTKIKDTQFLEMLERNLIQYNDSSVARGILHGEDLVVFDRNIQTLKEMEQTKEIYKRTHITVFEKNQQWTYKFGQKGHPLYDIDLLGGFLSALTGVFGTETSIQFSQYILSNSLDDRFVVIASDDYLVTALHQSFLKFPFEETLSAVKEVAESIQ